MLRPFARDPRARPARDDRGVPALRPPPRAPHRRHRPAVLGRARLRQAGDLRGRPGDDARPRPRHLSLRHLLEPGRRAPPASAPASGPADIDEVWGVAKAYATRVGAGPFPTELDDELGAQLRERGRRVRHHHRPRPPRAAGSTSSALRYAVRLNAMSALAITKLDVLAGHRPAQGRGPLPPLRGRRARRLPLAPVDPPHRRGRVRGAAGFDGRHRRAAAREAELPQEARDYLRFIEEAAGVPIRLVGVGPGRDQVVWMGEGVRAALRRGRDRKRRAA